jgi:hypothetical protein
MWFTNYDGDPSRWSPREGYSELFKETVRLIRDQFKLEKIQNGVDMNRSGHWHEYLLQGERVRVAISRFQYGEVARMGRSLSPVFRLDIVMQRLITPEATWKDESYWIQVPNTENVPGWVAFLHECFPNWEWIEAKRQSYIRSVPEERTRSVKVEPESYEPRWEEFFRNPIEIVFPEAYPTEPPRFRVDTPRYRNIGVSHDHHMFDDGWLCILAGRSDWKVTDSILSGLNAALDWTVWHYKEYGW